MLENSTVGIFIIQLLVHTKSCDTPMQKYTPVFHSVHSYHVDISIHIDTAIPAAIPAAIRFCCRTCTSICSDLHYAIFWKTVFHSVRSYHVDIGIHIDTAIPAAIPAAIRFCCRTCTSIFFGHALCDWWLLSFHHYASYTALEWCPVTILISCSSTPSSNIRVAAVARRELLVRFPIRPPFIHIECTIPASVWRSMSWNIILSHALSAEYCSGRK